MTQNAECPAHWALAQERVEHEVVLLGDDEHDYGRNFADLWNHGEPFIHVEHDVVPWPGAVTQLAECPEPFCTFEAPIARGTISVGFGIGKHTPEPPAPMIDRWDRVESAAMQWLRERGILRHVHYPPVAHARSVVS